jgi:hypothetical protein
MITYLNVSRQLLLRVFTVGLLADCGQMISVNDDRRRLAPANLTVPEINNTLDWWAACGDRVEQVFSERQIERTLRSLR